VHVTFRASVSSLLSPSYDGLTGLLLCPSLFAFGATAVREIGERVQLQGLTLLREVSLVQTCFLVVKPARHISTMSFTPIFLLFLFLTLQRSAPNHGA